MANVDQTQTRPNYFQGMALAQSDLQDQQSFLDQQREIWASGLHNSGVIYGLNVSASGRAVKVTAGQAISPTGTDITVVSEQIVPSPADGAGLHDLFIGVELVAMDPSSESLIEGNTHYNAQIRFVFLPRGSSVPTDMVFLAAASIDAAGTVSSVDPNSRNYISVAGGNALFFSSQTGAQVGALNASTSQGLNKLSICADETEFTGLVDLAGGLCVRSGTSDIRIAQFDFLSESGPGTAPKIASLLGNAIPPDPAPLSVIDIDAQGNVWFGDAPQDQRAEGLTVRGDAFIEADRVLSFAQVGSLVWTDINTQSLSLANDAISTVSTQGIDMRTGYSTEDAASANPTAATLGVYASGKVGINVASPAYALSVDGFVQSTSGGYTLSNGYVQTTAANSTSIMVGTIIDWWRADDSIDIPGDYQICDGSMVTGVPAENPLYGKILPNLEGKFIVGAPKTNQVGVMHDAVTHKHEMKPTTTHTHPIAHTHSVSGQLEHTGSSGNSDSSDDYCSSHHHTHSLSAASGQPQQPDSGINTSVQPGFTAVSTATPDSVTMLKLIRVR